MLEEQRKEQIIAEVEEKLLSGYAFTVGAQSERSVRGYRPPCHRNYWSNAIKVIGEMARESNVFAQIASKLIVGLPLYQCDNELRAKVLENAASAIKDGYDDVIRRSSPEPGRFSDSQRAFTLYECILLDYWLDKAVPCTGSVGGVGWVVEELAIRNNVRTYQFDN
jgi:hypothetical protein